MRFYLVQRLERRNTAPGGSVGFDRHFTLEYMGSSEFEWGAIPKALKSVRSNPVSSKSIDLTINGITRPVFIVTHDGKHEQAARDLQAWGNGRGHRPPFCGKEASQFDDQFTGNKRAYNDTTAWWSIDDDVAFALDEENAAALVEAFNAKPVA